jgi:hypothetical protein
LHLYYFFFIDTLISNNDISHGVSSGFIFYTDQSIFNYRQIVERRKMNEMLSDMTRYMMSLDVYVSLKQIM